MRWDAYHEGILLKESIESYKKRCGYYPEAVLADTIYRTRENRQHRKDLGIRLSGPKLGRPSKNQQKNSEQKRIERQDNADRNAIEGKFGEGKQVWTWPYPSTSKEDERDRHCPPIPNHEHRKDPPGFFFAYFPKLASRYVVWFTIRTCI
ncbi:transposase [Sporosarcina limicola]|uniref:transposase n=1 Tax=Sporosarcina limicola TaxID=34101 RepID=UPI00178B06BB